MGSAPSSRRPEGNVVCSRGIAIQDQRFKRLLEEICAAGGRAVREYCSPRTYGGATERTAGSSENRERSHSFMDRVTPFTSRLVELEAPTLFAWRDQSAATPGLVEKGPTA